ncbi:glycosyltransferase family 4 protein [Endozoicomonas sp. ALC020]|uniref:glycosyltransferase family 4 protein n=1 Tax=unclassified Endozoicomonas TaxID=2644528 RepID=UPI003BAF9D36
MNIAIDGHNLGAKYGTGLAASAKSLAYNLSEMGHNVYPIYALSGIHNNKMLMSSSFFQNLATKGELDSIKSLGFALNTAKYIIGNFFPLFSRLKHIASCYPLELASMQNMLPEEVAGYLNAPVLYNSSYAISVLFGTETRINKPKSINLDILHLTMPLPIHIRGIKKIVTVHDIIPLKVPKSCDINLKYYYKTLMVSLKKADLIFATSTNTKNDLIEVLKIPEKKIHITYQAARIPDYINHLPDEQLTPLLNYYQLKKNKYFIFYGAIEPKKNLFNLVQAFRISKTDFPLIIIGKNGWLYEDVLQLLDENNSSNLRSKIRRIPYLPFTHILYLLKGARCLIFPSIYEGFGLPVLESMTIGTPVITSNSSSITEIAGNAAYLIDPNSIESIRKSIEFMSANDKIVSSMSERGLLQSDKFSLKNYQKRLSEGYMIL